MARFIAPSSIHDGRPDALGLPRIYFCHIPKCAGSSIASAIWEQIYSSAAVDGFGIEQVASQRASKALKISMMRTRETVLAYNLSIKSNYFGRGHSYCRPSLVEEFSNDWSFITILRHPVERWISEYVYNTHKHSSWVKNEVPLNEYLESKKGIATGQYLLRYFSNFSGDVHVNPSIYVDEALDNLSRFSVVGILDNLDEWVFRMNRCFGVSLDIPKVNVSPKNDVAGYIRSDAKVIKKIEKLCKYDLDLYHRYIERDGTFGR